MSFFAIECQWLYRGIVFSTNNRLYVWPRNHSSLFCGCFIALNFHLEKMMTVAFCDQLLWCQRYFLLLLGLVLELGLVVLFLLGAKLRPARPAALPKKWASSIEWNIYIINSNNNVVCLVCILFHTHSLTHSLTHSTPNRFFSSCCCQCKKIWVNSRILLKLYR